MSIPTRQIDGDVAVGRNVATGGDANIQGNVRVGHTLRVEGYLDAPNLKGAQKGMFQTADALKEAYPDPEAGWWALVGNGLPAQVYMATGGKWTAQTNADGTPKLAEGKIDASGYFEEITEALETVRKSADSAQTTADSAKTGVTNIVNKIGAADGIAALNRLGELSWSQFPAGKDNVLTFADFSDVSELESGSPSGLGVQSARVLFSSALGKFYQEVTLTDGSVKNYGEWADAGHYGTSEPLAGLVFTEPKAGKIYVCLKDGSVWVKDGEKNALRELGTAGPVKGYMFEEDYDGPFSSSETAAGADDTVCYNPATERFMLRVDGGDMYLNNWAGAEEYGEEYDEHGLIPLPGMYVCYAEMKLRYVYPFMEGLYSVELLNAEAIGSALAGKQAKLNSSTDISVGSSLSITERGKQRLFDDLWNQCYDCTVDHTKPASEQYVCNGVQMSYAEAVAVYNAPRVSYNNLAGCTSLIGAPKTLILASEGTNGDTVSFRAAFVTDSLRVVRVSLDTESAEVSDMYCAFYGNSALTEIRGVIDVGAITYAGNMQYAFTGCAALKSVRIKNLKVSLDLSSCAALDAASVYFLMINAANTAEISVRLHRTAYNGLSSSFIAEADAKGISFYM